MPNYIFEYFTQVQPIFSNAGEGTFSKSIVFIPQKPKGMNIMMHYIYVFLHGSFTF